MLYAAVMLPEMFSDDRSPRSWGGRGADDCAIASSNAARKKVRKGSTRQRFWRQKSRSYGRSAPFRQVVEERVHAPESSAVHVCEAPPRLTWSCRAPPASALCGRSKRTGATVEIQPPPRGRTTAACMFPMHTARTRTFVTSRAPHCVAHSAVRCRHACSDASRPGLPATHARLRHDVYRHPASVAPARPRAPRLTAPSDPPECRGCNTRPRARRGAARLGRACAPARRASVPWRC